MDVESGGLHLGEPRPGDRVRLLVVGDAGVGKSSLVHLLCRGAVLRGGSATVGCDVDAKLHAHHGVSHFVEFVEVGGAEKYRAARSVFFMQRFDGVLMVHDLTNRNSRANLERWRRELEQIRHDGDSELAEPNSAPDLRVEQVTGFVPWEDASGRGTPQAPLNRRPGPQSSGRPGPLEEWVDAGEMGWLPCLTVGNKVELLPSSPGASQVLEWSAAAQIIDVGSFSAFVGRVIDHQSASR
ncbi:P-loop containing nucleoside triphosphate hydrolase protein [Pavlovales sp. CCMP2436]|nr:P-loop containing nucleoside triphosphate hydrolase protein [Pavlovales sp. CCMP2436]